MLQILLPFLLFIAVVVVAVFMRFFPIGLWLSAKLSGLKVGIFDLFGMRIRGVAPEKIILPAIMLYKSGNYVSINQLESHTLAGGSVMNVAQALIAAQKAGLKLDFQKATSIDLAGRDVLDAVRLCVKPRVIQTPLVSAMAKNGIQVKAIALVTVKANIDRIVGGAGEDTILARVGEGIVTTIGSAESHEVILENPDSISRTIQSKGLDASTGFEILSIDIADVDIGENIGAKLQIDQADADMKIARAKAAERRAMAEAKEQEMKAYEQEMKAKLVESEAEIPRAISEALESGNMGILDYYTLKNINSDTEMRQSFSSGISPN